MLDQCLVVDTTDNTNEIIVFSPMLDEELIIQADDVVMNIISESEEQIFLIVNTDTKKVVEED